VFKRTVGYVKALDGVDFTLARGQCLGVVGESGSGKTSLGLALLRLIPSMGKMVFIPKPGADAIDLQKLPQSSLRPWRAQLQMVFQDPYGALSPRLTVGEIIAEGLAVHQPHLAKPARAEKIAAVLQQVGLSPEMQARYPHEFSGGQRQRIAIARALILRPQLVILDEPTSALDMTTQAQIVDLLRDLQRAHGLSYIVISHDLRVIRALAHQVMVLRGGKTVETASAAALFAGPKTDYTSALLAAAFMDDPI
jgi:microcin C transport system ATP-binding protein